MTFQTFMTGRDAAGQPAPSFGDYPPDFFDFIAAVLRQAAFLADGLGVDPHERVFREGRERIVGLVGEDVAVGKEQDAWSAGGLGFALPVGEVPPAPEQLPGELEGNEGLAGAGRERQQDTVLPRGNGFQCAPMAMSW
jgi:hypothetical protein